VTTATITQLFVYPVKSTRALARSRVRLTATGLEWDRQWMLIDANGTFLSQRTHPKLACLVPTIGSDALQLEAPGRSALRVPFGAGGERRAVRVHADACIGVDQGTEAAQWASDVLGQTVRLVRVPQDPARLANPRYAGATPAPMGFADGFPLLVCNAASLADLNRRMPAPIPMERFRPNLVIEGLPAWAEDHIATLTVGPVTLRLVKPCARCTIPSVDQRSGERSTDPGPVLRQFRFDAKLPGIMFGENVVIAAGVGEELGCGMSCRVAFDEGAASAS
jgi:MOSC domain-containing protein